MALSNIFREPRREITEQITGLAAVAPFAWLDYTFAAWLDRVSAGGPNWVPLPVGLLFGALALVGGGCAAFLLMTIVHKIGEGICNALENRGVYLRPRERFYLSAFQRYQRR